MGKEPLILYAIVASHLAFPKIALCKAASADASFIDTAMPSSIPAEIIADWKLKDNVTTNNYSPAIAAIKSALPSAFASKIDTGSTEALYLKACHWRRVARMREFSPVLKRLLCARHYNEGGIITGYLEDLSDDTAMVNNVREVTTSRGSRYKAGSAFLILNFDDYYPAAQTLFEDKTGVIRDPCVSFDAKRIAFAWSKDNNGYHIFEMEIAKPDGGRQLTFDLPDYKVSDYEPCYCPNGDIVFNSSRCFQGIAITANLASNLYIMNKDGKYLRRIGYDQAQTFHPTAMSNGQIMFSRWEFNDRHPGYVISVFSMNPDGTHQNEYFGNQMTWPNTFPNAREIPDSRGKFISLIGYITGSVYQGDLVLTDPSKGRNAVNAVQVIAPKRDIYIDVNKKFQDPYPLSETWFLVSYSENQATTAKYRLYFMDVDGNRELLAWDANQSLCQPIPLLERKVPRLACQADYSKTTAELVMTNAYFGTGVDSSIKPGVIKKIRIIGLEYRMYPAFGAIAELNTPIGRYEGSYEAKRIIGEMKVETDGSAAFIVPARTPFFVQLIDTGGCMIQSMRSWMTMQPGEKFDCFGCHEDKNVSPPPATPIAQKPKPLDPFYDVVGGYMHYPDVIQPILNDKCVSCHVAGHVSGLDLTGDKLWTGDLANDENKTAQRYWCKSYLSLTDTAKKFVNYISSGSNAEPMKPDSVGSMRSRLILKLRERSGAMADVTLSEAEMAKMCAWIDLCIPHGGTYMDDMKPELANLYEERLLRRKQEDSLEAQNIAEFVQSGGYKNADYGGSFVNFDNPKKTAHGPETSGDARFQVRFSLLSRNFVLKVPCAGSIVIVDLKGRRVLQTDITREEYGAKSGRINRCFRGYFPAGLYIAKFKGKGYTGERAVPAM